jgi:hypothetical protein
MNSAYFLKVIALTVIIGLLAEVTSVYAQQKVYKWVDKEGVVHFSEEPPDESLEVEVKEFTTEPAPPYVPPTQTIAKSRSPSETDVPIQSAQPEIQMPAPAKLPDITEMSLADLNRRCDEAREKKIAPLREAEIAKCIETGTGDQAWCETFWADYGAPQRTKSGTFTPPMFHDLPECQDAWNESNRRGLYPE